MKIRSVVFTIIITVSFINLSYARTGVESLAGVEKLFMEAKYDRVVAEAGKLIDAGAHGREELNYLKGLSLLQLNRYSEARQTFEYMVERYPRGKRAFDGYIGIGDSYFLEGKFNEAVVAYNEALKNFPDHKNSSIVYYKMGNSYQKLGINDKAREYLGRVKQAAPLSFEANMAAVPDEKLSPVKSGGISDVKISGKYYVQVGYFRDKSNAQRMKDRLTQKGYDSSIETAYKLKMTFYRVKVGSYESAAEAEKTAKKLKTDGYKTKVCR
ncbi:MAG: SPOR domain-containing protein [Candidatus Omnitrophota bacterium]|nr:SPOR domain-containing protein [Candidatus Omnitrophota bacterium]